MKILSISGGGFQALYNVILLEELEKLAGPVKNSFDLFCGTSAGAIVAAAGARGMPMADLRAGFEFAKVYYAVKANPAVEIIDLLRDKGSSFDIASA